MTLWGWSVVACIFSLFHNFWWLIQKSQIVSIVSCLLQLWPGACTSHNSLKTKKKPLNFMKNCQSLLLVAVTTYLSPGCESMRKNILCTREPNSHSPWIMQILYIWLAHNINIISCFYYYEWTSSSFWILSRLS